MIRAALLALAAFLAPPAAAEPLHIGTEADYAPCMFRDDDGALTGWDHAVGELICARLKRPCAWIVEPEFSALIPGLAAGRCDIVVAALSATPGRAEVVDFTRSYRTDGTNLAAFAALRPGLGIEGARIGVVAGTIHAADLAADLARNEDAVAALLAGGIDLFFGPRGVSDGLRDTGLPQLRIPAETEVGSHGISIAVARGAPGLHDRIDRIHTGPWDDGPLAALEALRFPTGDPA